MENKKMENNKIEAPVKEASNAQIITQDQSSLQVFDPEADINRAKKAAKALMQVVEATKPLKMNGKTYLYFEHWQTIARFFNATVGIESTSKIGNGFEAKSVVYQNGNIIGGAEASCTRDESKTWGLKDRLGEYVKPDFQLKSMAQTRAMAKALRSIFGYVAVLAGVEATPAEEFEQQNEHVEVKPQPEKKQSQYWKFRALVAAAKNVEDLAVLAKSIELAKQAGELTSMDIGKLRMEYTAKMEVLKE